VSRVVVTGATGFIGRGTLSPLLAAGLEVHAVTSRTPPAATPAGVHWHLADLLDPPVADALMAAIAPSHLLHLAWYAQPGAFWTSPENLRWVEASLRLLRSFADNGGQRATIGGTCAEYEWGHHTVCREATTPCLPATLYGTSKHALRLIAERYCERVGVSLAWGRIFFVFGPGEDPARLGGSVARALALGAEAPCSHGEQLRDFLYSEDLAEAFVALLCSDVAGAVNLASGQPTRIRDLVQALGNAAGRPELVRLGARPAGALEPVELIADVTRLHDEVGWRPSRTLDQRAADTIAWWRDQLTDAVPPPGNA